MYDRELTKPLVGVCTTGSYCTRVPRIVPSPDQYRHNNLLNERNEAVESKPLALGHRGKTLRTTSPTTSTANTATSSNPSNYRERRAFVSFEYYYHQSPFPPVLMIGVRYATQTRDSTGKCRIKLESCYARLLFLPKLPIVPFPSKCLSLSREKKYLFVCVRSCHRDRRRPVRRAWKRKRVKGNPVVNLFPRPESREHRS